MQHDNRKTRMLTKGKRKPSFKFWLELRGKPILGKGGAQILKQMERDCSISKVAASLGMSYRYVWNYLDRMNKALGENVVETYKGGKSGGGGAKLTRQGRDLMVEYYRLEGHLGGVLSSEEYGEVMFLKISARNRFKGKVIAVEKDGITAKVKVDVEVPATVTAIISREAVEDLKIKVGDEVEAIVKATEVMIAK
jgi:molybdate transport system regulatory protein